MPALLSFRQANLGADTSNLTGVPWLVADYRLLTVSIESSTASASRYTIVGSNDDGLSGTSLRAASALTQQNGWSIVTVVTAPGVYGFATTGFRWINAFRDAFSVSASSNATVTFEGRW